MFLISEVPLYCPSVASSLSPAACYLSLPKELDAKPRHPTPEYTELPRGALGCTVQDKPRPVSEINKVAILNLIREKRTFVSVLGVWLLI